MSSPTKPTAPAPERPSPLNNVPRFGEDKQERQERGLGPHLNHHQHLPMPGLSGPPNGPIGNLLKGTVDKEGNLKDASLSVGIKLDLEAEVHLTARIRGDILVGLY
ncbi:unnamed protein product [Discula destructiva]